jgi:hypothetical protein
MGKTQIVFFTGLMNVEGYVETLKKGLLPFIRTVYPDGHRLMQDTRPEEHKMFFLR